MLQFCKPPNERYCVIFQPRTYDIIDNELVYHSAQAYAIYDTEGGRVVNLKYPDVDWEYDSVELAQADADKANKGG